MKGTRPDQRGVGGCSVRDTTRERRERVAGLSSRRTKKRAARGPPSQSSRLATTLLVRAESAHIALGDGVITRTRRVGHAEGAGDGTGVVGHLLAVAEETAAPGAVKGVGSPDPAPLAGPLRPTVEGVFASGKIGLYQMDRLLHGVAATHGDVIDRSLDGSSSGASASPKSAVRLASPSKDDTPLPVL